MLREKNSNSLHRWSFLVVGEIGLDAGFLTHIPCRSSRNSPVVFFLNEQIGSLTGVKPSLLLCAHWLEPHVNQKVAQSPSMLVWRPSLVDFMNGYVFIHGFTSFLKDPDRCCVLKKQSKQHSSNLLSWKYECLCLDARVPARVYLRVVEEKNCCFFLASLMWY